MSSPTPRPEKTSAELSGGAINGAQAKFGARRGIGCPNSGQAATFSAACWREKLIGSDRQMDGILGEWMKTDNMKSRAEEDDENWGGGEGGEEEGRGGLVWVCEGQSVE